MAAATPVTVVTASFAGATFETVDIDKANGNTIVNNRGATKVIIANGHSTDAITATFDVSAEISEGALGKIPAQDVTVTIPAQTSKIVGPWSGNFETNGLVKIAWSGIPASSDVQIAAIK